MYPTNRGICFSLKANPNRWKRQGFCTVPAQRKRELERLLRAQATQIRTDQGRIPEPFSFTGRDFLPGITSELPVIRGQTAAHRTLDLCKRYNRRYLLL